MKTQDQAQVQVSFKSASYQYRIHNHTYWKTGHSDCCSNRAEWDASFKAKCQEISGRVDHYLSIYNLGDFLAEVRCGNEPAKLLKTLRAIWKRGEARPEFLLVHGYAGALEIEIFSSESAAQVRMDEVETEVGYNEMTCDRGNHDGENEVLEISNICIVLKINGTRVEFRADSEDQSWTKSEVIEILEETFNDEELTEAVLLADQIVAELNAQISQF